MSRFWKKKLLCRNDFFVKIRSRNTNTLPIPKTGVKSVTEKETLPNLYGSGSVLEQDTGIEPATVAWEATVLPLN